MEAIVRGKADLLQVKIESMTRSMHDLSELLTLIHDQVGSESFHTQMEQFLKTNHFYDLILLTPQGDIVYTYNRSIDLNTNVITGPFKNTYLASSFVDALEKKPVRISNFSYYIPSSNYAAFMAIPVFLNGKLINVAAIQIQNKDLHRVVNNYDNLGRRGEVHVATLKGDKCIYMAPTRFGHHPAFSIEKHPKDHPLMVASKGQSGSKYYIDKSGNPVGAAWTYIPELNWGIMAKMPESELLEAWNRQSRVLLYEYSFLYLMVMAVLYYLYISIRKPLTTILEGTKSFAEGKFDHPIIVERNDEIGLLAETYNIMAERIRRDFSVLNEKNQHLLEQKKVIESFNEELEKRVDEKSNQLLSYIKIVDENVITSTTDLKGTITSVSQAFCTISGYSADELIGRYHNIVRHPDMPDLFFKDLWETITSGHTWHGEVKNRRKDGTFYWVSTVISPVYDNGKGIGFTSIRQDITDRKRAEELAITDSLTGLFNRRHFNAMVEKELNRAKRNNAALAMILLDIDYFKQYNDNYGHLAGDAVLVEISKVLLEHSLRANDHSFRLGGEEFAIIMYGMNRTNTYEIGEYIRHRVQSLQIPHAFSSVSPYVTVSIGIALEYAVNLNSFDELFKIADDNLYHSKANGRNQLTFK